MPRETDEKRHRVVALCLPGTVAFDLTAPAQAFGVAHAVDGTPHYAFSTCSPHGAPVKTTSGFEIGVQAGLGALRSADTVVVPGYLGVFDPLPAETTEALRAAARRGARVMSVCTGAFALAYAGLLDGRRATTHWGWAAELAARFPTIEVEPEVLFVDEGDVLTSAGLSAGIDLSLHAIRTDHGAACADRVARHMVAAPHREGGQAQFFDAAEPGGGATDHDGSLEPTRAWARERLAEPLTVEAMAARAAVSPRTFARRFRAETGTTPLQWLLAQRVLAARRLLEESDLPIEEVAARAGFGGTASLRLHFRRATATSPTAYRRTFRPELELLSKP
ncbi:MAG TPA: helix-turn-helix domain-containing protein [Solirubrobacterales bacterium]|nr:helix-turn-helix domain-containing protein [Solirubrobacterales bacterium]